MKHSNVVRHLRKAGCRVHEINCDGGGYAAVCAIGGRVASMRFKGLDENIFWSSPQLHDHAALRRNPWGLTGGPGGVRLWFAPEYAYHWKGRPDLAGFKNYSIPRQSDPGPYEWEECTPSSASLSAKITLDDHRDGSKVTFTVQRAIIATPCPLDSSASALRDLRHVGLRFQHVLKMRRARPSQRVDLWHLIQMPVGSRLLIPTVMKPQPLVYFDPNRRNGWKCEADRLTWQYTGDARAKIGLDVSQVTGRAGVLRRMGNGDWAAVIWQFPVMPGLPYCDGPDERRARQQVCQAWDGYGFGELECHSSSVGMNDPDYAETSLLWCFAGSFAKVNEAAQQLMRRRW
ncbi:MAG: hypothetical protein HY360_25695 [Verrucomicrobia bacterium]|nr:hypothetical protein [Verrucomicrobiota bacterium]